jgi:hypothetical protein
MLDAAVSVRSRSEAESAASASIRRRPASSRLQAGDEHRRHEGLGVEVVVAGPAVSPPPIRPPSSAAARASGRRHRRGAAA